MLRSPRAFGVSFVIAALWLLGLMSPASSEENLFKKYNPDIGKYEFARSFITGLGYYSRVSLRLAAEEERQGMVDDVRLIRSFIDNRTMDNSEIRIARNYLVKYASSENGLIRKVAGDAMAVYDRILAMSSRERELWQGLYRLKTDGETEGFSEADFTHQQFALAQEKKEAAKDLIKASLLLGKVLLSGDRCASEECRELAVTREERDKLVEKLDAFARATTDWGAKAGHTTLEACVAAIREVLEDPLYISR